ncbi:hypothetical protein [Deinococcus marmoris]|uniref:hypothetical protein n=1 Tax=Deinococcus marmoris TaxID=249408 RepID=UPI00111514D9|nr:hypothetical protein [Deinococcus marmoris]
MHRRRSGGSAWTISLSSTGLQHSRGGLAQQGEILGGGQSAGLSINVRLIREIPDQQRGLTRRRPHSRRRDARGTFGL